MPFLNIKNHCQVPFFLCMSINCLKQNIDVIVDLSCINLNWFFDIIGSFFKLPLDVQLYYSILKIAQYCMCNTYIDYTVKLILLIEDYICSKLIAQYLIIFIHKNIDVSDIITVLNIKSLKLYILLLIILIVKLLFSPLYFVL